MPFAYRILKLVEGAGVEPAKPEGRLGYSQGISPVNAPPGADDRPRTDNLMLTRQLLCQIELRQPMCRGRRRGAPPGLYCGRSVRDEALPRQFTQSTLLKIVYRGIKKPRWFRTDQGFWCRSGRFELQAFQNRCPERLNAWVHRHSIHANPRSYVSSRRTTRAGARRWLSPRSIARPARYRRRLVV